MLRNRTGGCAMAAPGVRANPTTTESAARRVMTRVGMTNSKVAPFEMSAWQTSGLYKDDFHDFITLAAARRIHLYTVADFLANQSAPGRRGDRDLAGLHVRLGLADNLEDFLLFRIFIDQRHRGAEFDG